MREAESQLLAAVAAASVVVFALDRSGVFTVCEGRGLEALGLVPADVVGHTIFDVRELPGIDAYRCAFGAEPFSVVFEAKGIAFEARVSAQHDGRGAVTGAVGIVTRVDATKPWVAAVHDETETVEMLSRLVGELGNANRFKSDMVAIIAHELRTPLNAIMGYTDLLMEGEFGPLTPEQLEISRRVDRSAQVLRDLIAGTLELSRLDSGQLPLSLRDCDLLELMREVDAETGESRAKPGVSFRWHMPPRLPHLRSDPLKIKVILKNLIANAVKFTQRGEICVAASTARDGVEITVTDTGIGIGADVLPHVFEPFRQGEHHATRRFGGVGLGLYLVRRLVDVLGGTVAVESVRGHGSLFRVWLPLIHPTRHLPQPLKSPVGGRRLRSVRTNRAA